MSVEAKGQTIATQPNAHKPRQKSTLMGRKKCGEVTWQPSTAVTHRCRCDRVAFCSLPVLLFVKLHTRLVVQKEQGYTLHGAANVLESCTSTSKSHCSHFDIAAISPTCQRSPSCNDILDTSPMQPSIDCDLLLYKRLNVSATRLPKTVPWSHAPISLITSQRQGSTISSGAGYWSNPVPPHTSSLALIMVISVTAPLHHLPLLESHTRTSSHSRRYSFLCPR
jgi:hypothetical protein